MTNVFLVAEEFCKNFQWKLTHLELQNLLYIGQMFSLGQRKGRLFADTIYAWKYGPIVPRIYEYFLPIRLRRIYESDFEWHIRKINEHDMQFIADLSNELQGIKDWQLTSITQRENGAWDLSYIPKRRDIVIPISAIEEEYHKFWDDNN